MALAHFEPQADDAASHWSVGDLLKSAAEKHPDRMAIKVVTESGEVLPENSWTYRELYCEAQSVARLMLLDFEPGENVAIWLSNRREWPLIQFGAALAGLTLVTINPVCKAAEVDFMLRQSDAAGIFYPEHFRDVATSEIVKDLLGKIPNLRVGFNVDDWDSFRGRNVDPDSLPEIVSGDPAMIQFTSGTTGAPKGALLTHYGLVNGSRMASDRFDLEPGTSWLNVLPMFHTGGCVFITLGTIWNGGTQVMLSGFDPGVALRMIEEQKIAFTSMVPTMLLWLKEHPDFSNTDLSSLQCIAAGGSAIAESIVKMVENEFGADFIMVFGQTEACGSLTTSRRVDTIHHRTLTIGTPLPNTEMRIADVETGTTASVNEVGEIQVKSECLFSCYYGNEEASRSAFTKDGWYRTGDMGVMEEDGYFRITGRLKEMIIRGGENIYPREVEDVLADHPDVLECAVFGIPDDHWGERVAVAVRCDANAQPDTEDLRAYLAERIARFKVPSDWYFVDQFPVTASGKIQKFALTETFADQPSA